MLTNINPKSLTNTIESLNKSLKGREFLFLAQKKESKCPLFNKKNVN
jgi:hypothetical protein